MRANKLNLNPDKMKVLLEAPNSGSRFCLSPTLGKVKFLLKL